MDQNDPVRKQLELNSLIEFSQLISSKLDLKYILNNILLSTMGKLLISKGLVMIKTGQGDANEEFTIEAIKGLAQELTGRTISIQMPKIPVFESNDIPEPKPESVLSSLQYFFKIYFQNKLLGVLCLGKKLNNIPLSNAEIISIETMLNISASAIENTIRFNEAKLLNADLNNKVRQLRSLFELSKEFNTNITDSSSIIRLLSYTLLGNFGIRDFIIYSRRDEETFQIIRDGGKAELMPFGPDIIFPFGNTEPTFLKTIRVCDHKDDVRFRSLYENGFELVIPAAEDNEVVNVICLGGKLNKLPYTASDIEFLESIVNLSLLSIRNSLLFNEYLQKQVLENDLKTAREIQVALLPGKIPKVKGFDFAGTNIPAKEVGGDYFDIIKLNECQTSIVIADVSGKGTPASLLMASIQSAVHSYLKLYDEETFDIASVTSKINELIYENTMPEKFITFFWGIIDCRKSSLRYINAGHNPPLLFKRDKVLKLDKGGFMIGILDSCVSYEVGEVLLDEGDVLVLYTDGVTEAQNLAGDEYGDERLEELCRENQGKDPHSLLNTISDDVLSFFSDTFQYDDITLIVVKKS